MAAKAGAGAVTVETLYRSLLMTFGISNPWLCAVLAIVLGVGVWQRWRKDSGFTAYVLGAMLVGSAAIALSRPAWIQHQQTFVRYVLPMVPFVLLFLAEGLVFVLAQLRISALAAAAGALVDHRSRRRGSDSRLLLLSKPADGPRAVPVRLRRRGESVFDASRARTGARVLSRSRHASARQHHADRNAGAARLALPAGSVVPGDPSPEHQVRAGGAGVRWRRGRRISV